MPRRARVSVPQRLRIAPLVTGANKPQRDRLNLITKSPQESCSCVSCDGGWFLRSYYLAPRRGPRVPPRSSTNLLRSSLMIRLQQGSTRRVSREVSSDL